MARFFIDHYNRKFKRQLDGITPEAGRVLMAHDWPGNVRELRNAIERAMILEESTRITPASLPGSLSQPGGLTNLQSFETNGSMPPSLGLGISLEENERRLVQQALEETGGNQTRAAKLLKVTRDTLRYKMKKFALR